MKAIYKNGGILLWLIATIMAFLALTTPGYGGGDYRTFLGVTVSLMGLLAIYFFLWGQSPGHIFRFIFILFYLAFSTLLYLRNLGFFGGQSANLYIVLMIVLPTVIMWLAKKNRKNFRDSGRVAGEKVNYFDVYFK